MPGGFDELIELIKNGEPVSGGVTNRPIAKIDQNTRYLMDLIKAATIGSTIFARQVTVDAAVLQGEAVYYNANTSRFERAIAGVSSDINQGVLAVSESTRVWGVVYKKINATLADLLLYGFATLDITAALDTGETLKAATYYLSGTSAGKLASSRTFSGVVSPVLRTTGDGRVFVSPRWEEDLFARKPAHFRLKAVPAGTHTDPGAGNRHTITVPNVAVEGWLPADHASFEGKAPPTAAFGYNLNANPALKRAWPPLPPESAALLDDGIQVPAGNGGDGGLVMFTRDGIWWMSDCYEDVPFLPTGNTSYEAVSESIDFVSESVSDECPFVYARRLDLYFSQFTYLSESTVVTSLISKDNRLIVECQGAEGTPASVGPLQLRLELEFLSDNVDPGGYRAIKSWDADNNKFHFGPVATAVYSKSTSIELTSDATTEEDIDDETVTLHHGRVGVDLVTSFNRELFPQLVRLDGVLEQYYSNVMYLGFPSDELTSFRARINVPQTLDLTSPKLKLKFRLLGRGSGTLPALTVTMRRIPKTVVGTPVALPTSDSAVTINTAVALTTNQYVDIEATSFVIAAGDDVLFTVQRAADDAYNFEVGILRISALVVS